MGVLEPTAWTEASRLFAPPTGLTRITVRPLYFPLPPQASLIKYRACSKAAFYDSRAERSAMELGSEGCIFMGFILRQIRPCVIQSKGEESKALRNTKPASILGSSRWPPVLLNCQAQRPSIESQSSAVFQPIVGIPMLLGSRWRLSRDWNASCGSLLVCHELDFRIALLEWLYHEKENDTACIDGTIHDYRSHC